MFWTQYFIQQIEKVCNQWYFVFCPAAKRKTNGNRDMIWKRQIKISKILEWPRSRKERTIMAKRKRMPCNFLINQMYTKQQQYTLQSGWMKDLSVFFVHKFLLRENLIFVRPFPPRAEDDNVSVSTDARLSRTDCWIRYPRCLSLLLVNLLMKFCLTVKEWRRGHIYRGSRWTEHPIVEASKSSETLQWRSAKECKGKEQRLRVKYLTW